MRYAWLLSNNTRINAMTTHSDVFVTQQCSPRNCSTRIASFAQITWIFDNRKNSGADIQPGNWFRDAAASSERPDIQVNELDY